MDRKFHPEERNLTVNPELTKTNSPWALLTALILIGCLVLIYRSYFTPDVSITSPTLETLGQQVKATTYATNRTGSSIQVKLRMKIGELTSDRKGHPGRFNVLDQHVVSATVAPRSTVPITCEFRLGGDAYANRAEADLIAEE